MTVTDPVKPGWYVESDHTVVVDRLRLAETGAYINNATMTGQMYDEDNVAVGSVITFSYVTSSNGRYIGLVPSSLADTLVAGATYRMKIVMSLPGGFKHTEMLSRLAGYDQR